MIFKIIFNLYTKLLNVILIPIFSLEPKLFLPQDINERSIEYSFLFEHLWKICPKEILDVGTGSTALPHVLANCGFKVIAIDEKGSYWDFSYFNRHYRVKKDNILDSKINKKFDFISCISVLEHIADKDKAIKEMFKLLKPNGHLMLTFPYNENSYIKNVYNLEGAGYGQNFPYICQIFSRNEIDRWIKENNGKIIDQRYYDVFTGNLWTFGEKICPPKQVNKESKHQLTCLIIKKF